MPTGVEAIKAMLEAEPELYSNEELPALGIDPDLFVFISRPDFSDNAHALWQYIVNNTGYKTFWLMLDREVCAHLQSRGLACATHNSALGLERGRKAHYIVTTLDYYNLKKHRGQIFINLWHGSGIKCNYFFDRRNHAQPFAYAKQISELTDLFLLQNTFDKFNLAALLNCDARKMAVSGQARLDHIKTADGKFNLNRVFPGLAQDYRNLIILAPTMRRSNSSIVGRYYSPNPFGLDDFDGPSFNALLAKYEAAVVIKLHPIEEFNFKIEDLAWGRHCYLLKSQDMAAAGVQMNEVMNAFAVMITDYSSIACDFLILDRPLIYNIPDREEYGQRQGFVYNHIDFWMPGAKVFNFAELLSALEEAFINPGKYKPERQTNITLRYDYQDSNSAKRALREIENFQPIVNYGERYFIQEKLLPAAEAYEAQLQTARQQITRLQDKIAAVSGLLEALPASPEIRALLDCLSAPDPAPAAAGAAARDALLRELEAAADGGETVFWAPILSNYAGKSKSRLRHLAEQISQKGYLFFMGSQDPDGADYQISRRSDNFYELNLGNDIAALGAAIARLGKKAVLCLESGNFLLPAAALPALCARAAKTIYFVDGAVEDYRARAQYGQLEVSAHEFYNYALEHDFIDIIVPGAYARDSLGPRGRRAHIIESGVDNAFFQARINNPSPALQELLAPIKRSGKPIIGYCGAINRDIYIALTQYLCQRFPEYNFVYAGKNELPALTRQTFTLFPNFWELGEVAYAETPALIKSFDAALLPYFPEAARRKKPSKLFEYLACGKPVLAARMPELAGCPFVFRGDSHHECARQLQQALNHKNNPEFARRAQAWAADNDWGHRADELLGLILN